MLPLLVLPERPPVRVGLAAAVSAHVGPGLLLGRRLVLLPLQLLQRVPLLVVGVLVERIRAPLLHHQLVPVDLVLLGVGELPVAGHVLVGEELLVAVGALLGAVVPVHDHVPLQVARREGLD